MNPIIPLVYPDKKISYQASINVCRNTSFNSSSGKYMIKITGFDFITPEEEILFLGLIQKALVGQHITASPSTCKCMEKVVKGDAKDKFIQQTNLLRSCMMVCIFPEHTLQWCSYRFLRKPKDMKICTVQFNKYLPFFLPDCMGKMIISHLMITSRKFITHNA